MSKRVVRLSDVDVNFLMTIHKAKLHADTVTLQRPTCVFRRHPGYILLLR